MSIRKSFATKLIVGILVLTMIIFTASLGVLFSQSRHLIRVEALNRSSSVLNTTLQQWWVGMEDSPVIYGHHLFITDRSGRSVIVEWIDNEMAVTEDCKVTNHILCSGYTEGDPDTDSMNRYNILTDNLSACGGTADAATAMIFLSNAALRSDDPGRIQTEWSCVYDLDDFKVTICTDTVYDHSFTVTPESFNA